MMPGTQICLTKIVNMGLPGSPVVKIPWALGSKFLVRKLTSHMLHGVAKKKKMVTLLWLLLNFWRTFTYDQKRDTRYDMNVFAFFVLTSLLHMFVEDPFP